MKELEIKHLLEKYWDGETTIAEERELKHYFSSSQVSDELQEYKPLFQFFKSEQKKVLESSVENTLRSIKMDSNNTGARIINFRKMISGIAVAFLIVMAAMSVIKYETVQTTNQSFVFHEGITQEIDDPEKALEETKKALELLGAKLNKSSNKIENSIVKTGNLKVFK